MKKLIGYVCAFLIAVGCGSDGTGYEPAEFAQVEQALSMWDGYGTDGLQNRCWHDGHTVDWGDGKCNVPAVKKIWIQVNLSGCNGTYAADYLAGVTEAISYVKSVANSRGWTVLSSLTTLNPGNGPMLVTDLNCGVALPGQHPSSQAATQQTAGPGTCTSTQDGQLCQFTSALVRIVPSRVQSAEFVRSGTTQLMRRTFIYNITAHEIFHVLGLGHDECGNNPLAQLMGGNACQPASSASWYKAVLRQFEKDLLFNYSP